MREIDECNEIIESFLHQWDTTDMGWRFKNWRDNTRDDDIEELNEICDRIEEF